MSQSSYVVVDRHFSLVFHLFLADYFYYVYIHSEAV